MSRKGQTPTRVLLPDPKHGSQVIARFINMPGDNIKMVVTLIAPIAMDEGLRFAIREGGRTVGAGVVAKIVQ